MPLSRKSIRARRDFLLRLVLAGVALGVLVALFRWLTFDRNWVTTDNAFVTGNILPVNADATGVVAAVLVEETQLVKKGEVLIRLDAQRARVSCPGGGGSRSRRAHGRCALRQSSAGMPESDGAFRLTRQNEPRSRPL